MEMRVAIVGFGYWGEILYKSIIRLKRKIDYICVVDSDLSKKEKANSYKIDFYNSIDKVFEKVDVFIVATWEDTHYQLVKQCLMKGKHVFVEKPLSLNYKDALELVRIAESKKVILMTDHIFVYDRSFNLIKKKIDRGDVGELQRIDSFRFSVNIVKPFTNVIVDLFLHDLSVFNSLFDIDMAKICLVSRSCLINKKCDSASIGLKFGKIETNSFLSWVYPLPRREMVFYGKKGVLSWEKKDGQTDLVRHYLYNKEGKLEIVNEAEIGFKDKTLLTVFDAFFESVITLKQPLTSGEAVLKQVKIFEKVLKKV